MLTSFWLQFKFLSSFCSLFFRPENLLDFGEKKSKLSLFTIKDEEMGTQWQGILKKPTSDSSDFYPIQFNRHLLISFLPSFFPSFLSSLPPSPFLLCFFSPFFPSTSFNFLFKIYKQNKKDKLDRSFSSRNSGKLCLRDLIASVYRLGIIILSIQMLCAYLRGKKQEKSILQT